MNRFISALFGFGACVLLLMSSGCSSNKRLGESRIEARRYSKGWHVNNASSSSRTLAHAALPAEEPVVIQRPSVLKEEGSDVLADAGDMVFFDDQNTWPSPDPSVLEAGVADGHGDFIGNRHPHDRAALPSSSAFPDEVNGVFFPFDENEPETAGLPEAEAGRHPDAVPGFILSLGWLMGLLAAVVLDGLGSANPGIAFGLGLLVSLAGYFLSRSAYRVSKANPERYPRPGLSESARWIAGFPVLLGVIYLAVVVLVWVIILGVFLGNW